MSELFKTKKDQRGVLTVSLNRPEVHNAFNDEMIESLSAYFRDVSEDSSVRLIVLRGEGKSFCAGADLNWMKRMKEYSADENYRDSLQLAGLFDVINRTSQPVIGLVHGTALGGGSGLVSVCDYVLASEDTTFGFTEARLGLAPAVISPYVMAKIGESQARAFFMSGTKFGEQKAKEIGLVHQISLERHFHNDATKVIESFLKAGPVAQKAVKKMIREVGELEPEGPEKVRDYTCQTIAQLRIGDEAQDGMGALLEKRKPSWMEEKDK